MPAAVAAAISASDGWVVMARSMSLLMTFVMASWVFVREKSASWAVVLPVKFW